MPQSSRTRFPAASTRCIDPVTVWAAPQKVTLIGALAALLVLMVRQARACSGRFGRPYPFMVGAARMLGIVLSTTPRAVPPVGPEVRRAPVCRRSRSGAGGAVNHLA